MPILRVGYHNTRFGPQWTEPTYDVIFIGIIACFCTLYMGFILLLPSFKMNFKTVLRRASRLIRTSHPCAQLIFYAGVTWSLWMGWVIIDTIQSYEWHSDYVKTETFYAPYDPRRINATLGLHIGLRGFNITLTGDPILQFGQIINYNEDFRWAEPHREHHAWQQGRTAYGPYAGTINQKFREWQARGYPQIITELAEYFTIDAEEIRWGRWYRIAGWYGHIALWFDCSDVHRTIFSYSPFLGLHSQPGRLPTPFSSSSQVPEPSGCASRANA